MRVFVIVVVLVFAAPASSASPRTVHLYGDSIFKGWGYGHYDDASPLGRVDRIATMLARANGSALRFNRTTVQAPSRICMAVKDGTIRPTDSIVFEDAGPRETSAAARQRWLEHVVACATRHRGRAAGRQVASPSRLALSTMFDYQPAYHLSDYDAPLDDGRTANDVARQVARRSGAGLIDFDRLMDAAVADLPELRLVHTDGIHPTVFGNVVMAAAILHREGVRIRNVGPLVDALEADRDRLVGGAYAPFFDRSAAEVWAARLTR